MRSSGYTLIELLIVISIIALLSVVGFVNFKDFSSNQVAVKAAGQVQTLLRLAQSNATSSTTCNNLGSLSWSLIFLDNKTIELRCDPADYLQRTYTLENATISLQCSPNPSICPPSGATFNPPLKVSFSSLYGKVTFPEGDTCVGNASTVMIVVKNTNIDSYKCLTISKGGTINVQ